MSLPTAAIDRIFQRMSATYGAAWDRSLGNAPIMDVKTVWAHELQGFAGRLTAVAWALENLPESVPNPIQFRNLARRAPETETPRLPEPKADPARVREELSKLVPIIEEARNKVGDDRIGWAHRIVARAECGEPVAFATLKIAKDALARNGVKS